MAKINSAGIVTDATVDVETVVTPDPADESIPVDEPAEQKSESKKSTEAPKRK
jgi:hypothetical protein